MAQIRVDPGALTATGRKIVEQGHALERLVAQAKGMRLSGYTGNGASDAALEEVGNAWAGFLAHMGDVLTSLGEATSASGETYANTDAHAVRG